MNQFAIVFRPEARSDMRSIYFWIAGQGSDKTALRFVTRIEAACMRLSQFPERGNRRDEISKGLRTFGLDRRVTIAFRIDGTTVSIVRILYGGRDLESAFDGQAD